MMRERRTRYAGLREAPVRLRFKNLFGSSPSLPPPPPVQPPPTMPDPMSPENLAAQAAAQKKLQSAGRSSTVLTRSAATASRGAGATIAGGGVPYTAAKLSGA